MKPIVEFSGLHLSYGSVERDHRDYQTARLIVTKDYEIVPRTARNQVLGDFHVIELDAFDMDIICARWLESRGYETEKLEKEIKQNRKSSVF